MAGPLRKKKATTQKKFQGKEIDPILYRSEHSTHEIYFLTETKGMGEMKYLHQYMGKMFPHIGYKILSVFGLNVKTDDISRSPTAFYFKNGLDLSSYIPERKRIIPLGRALMGVTFDSDISVEGFYDSVFQKTHFYAPNLKSEVFPVDPAYKWFHPKEQRSLDNFYRKFLNDQIGRAVQHICYPKRTVELKKHVVTDVQAWMQEHWHKEVCAWDLETSSLDYQRGYILCLTMSFDGREGFYIRFKDMADLEMFDRFMENKYQIGANLKFDLKFMGVLHKFKNLTVHFDTWHAGHILNEMRSNSLKTHAWVYTNYGGYDLPLERYKAKYPKLKSYADIPEPLLREYATMDAIVTFQVYERMLQQLSAEPELYDYFFNIVMPQVQIFPEIEMHGVDMDWDMVREVGEEFTRQIKALEDEMKPIFGDINFNSDALPRKLEELGWPEIEKDSKGLFKTNKDCIKEWKELGLEGAELLEKRAKLVTAQGTFVGLEDTGTKAGFWDYEGNFHAAGSSEKGFWKYMGTDEKLHPNFFVMLANSHRYRCANPNLQNYPKHGPIAKLIRKCFTTPDGDFLLSESDYDGLQLRIAAIFSDDPVMRDIFLNKGGDMHSITGHSVFFASPKEFVEVEYTDGSKEEMLKSDAETLAKEKVAQITPTVIRKLTLEEFLKNKKTSPACKDARQKAKGVNFGLIFGSTVAGVCFNVVMKDWTPRECYNFIVEMELQKPQELEEMVPDDGDQYSDATLKLIFRSLAMVVAEYIHKMFFSTYARLVPWIEECHKEARDHGYIRTVHGARRLLPQLTYIGTESDKKEISGWENIAVNTRVQNFEVVVVGRSMVGIYHEWKEKNMRSRFFGMIHDAINKYIFAPEMHSAYAIIKEHMEKEYPEYKGIPLTAESDIAHPLHPMEEKRTFWGSSPVWEGEDFKTLYPELVA